MTLEPDRLGAIATKRLQRLLRVNLGIDAAPTANGASAAVVLDGTAWTYQPAEPDLALGRTLVKVAALGVDRVALVVDDVTAVLTGALAGLGPRVSIHQAVGETLVALTGVPISMPPAPPAGHPGLAALEAEGLDVVPGHGMSLGEVLGLEVARLAGAGCELQVGVGALDRIGFQALYVDRSPAEELPRVVAKVRSHRHAGAPPHLLNRLVRERWLRALVCAEPSSVGLDAAWPIAGVNPRAGLHQTVPDAALGSCGEELVLVVTSVGIDSASLVHAAALSAREGADRVLLVVPERDRHPAMGAASGFIAAPTTVLGMAQPWA